MKKLALALIVLATPAHAAEYRAEVISNYDGDSATILIDGRRDKLRLINVDTPEIKGACEAERYMAIRARDFTREWTRNKTIILETTKRERDKYKRLLAFVRNEHGEDLGEKLIEAGLAVKWEGRRHRGWCG